MSNYISCTMSWLCGNNPLPTLKSREKRSSMNTKHNLQIRSCFSCVCFLLLASFLSVFSETLPCLEAAGKVIPDLPLCLGGPVWLQAPLCHSLCCSSRRQGWDARRGLKSECGTGESRRTELWWPCAAAGCSFAQVDCRLGLQTNILISRKDHDHLTLVLWHIKTTANLFLLHFASFPSVVSWELKHLPAVSQLDVRSPPDSGMLSAQKEIIPTVKW